jgi:hypothetical protein
MLLFTKGNHKAVGIHKGQWPNDLDPVDALWNTQSNKLRQIHQSLMGEFGLVCFLT